MSNTTPPLNDLEAFSVRFESYVRSAQDAADVQSHINAALVTLLFTLTNLVVNHAGAERGKFVQAIEAAIEATGDKKNGLCGHILRTMIASFAPEPSGIKPTGWQPEVFEGGRMDVVRTSAAQPGAASASQVE